MYPLCSHFLWKLEKQTLTQCLKITEKVAFIIASEASYVYILNGQKLIKNAKNSQFGDFLKTWKKCDFSSDFQTLCIEEEEDPAHLILSVFKIFDFLESNEF